MPSNSGNPCVLFGEELAAIRGQLETAAQLRSRKERVPAIGKLDRSRMDAAAGRLLADPLTRQITADALTAFGKLVTLFEAYGDDSEVAGISEARDDLAHSSWQIALMARVQPSKSGATESQEKEIEREADIPATHRDRGEADGAPLTTTYLEENTDWDLKPAYITKQWNKGLLPSRLKFGRSFVYSHAEVAALRMNKTRND